MRETKTLKVLRNLTKLCLETYPRASRIEEVNNAVAIIEEADSVRRRLRVR